MDDFILNAPNAALLMAGGGVGLAAVITATFNGICKLIRARRGDPELPPRQSFLLGVVKGRGDA